jgi:MoxR-like ATPase
MAHTTASPGQSAAGGRRRRPPDEPDAVVSPFAPSEAALLLERVLFEIKRVVVGQDRMVERMLACLLARGHCLLEGVPGLAKTLAVETLADTVQSTFVRIQFTPDLVPSDIVGTRVYRPSREAFDVELGPVFANFVLADEINRAPAKVQSALLEVMAEGHASIGGTTYDVPAPFLVLATQNPIESEGVYPLPEAQRDRFLMKVLVDYPSRIEETEIVHRMGVDPPHATPVLDAAQLLSLQRTADLVFVHHALVEYAVHLVFATREPATYGLADLTEYIEYGVSPRASLGLIAASRALALLRGRDYVLPADVTDIAPEVLRHRIVLSYEALAEGVDPESMIEQVVTTIPSPQIAPHQDRPLTPPAAAPTGWAVGGAAGA